jgi:hypothetical protein
MVNPAKAGVYAFIARWRLIALCEFNAFLRFAWRSLFFAEE